MVSTTELRVLGQVVARPEAATERPAAPSGFLALPTTDDAEVVERVRRDLADDARSWREEAYPDLMEPWHLHRLVHPLGFAGGSSGGLHLSHIGFGIDLLDSRQAAVAAVEPLATMVTRSHRLGRFAGPLSDDADTGVEALNRLAYVGFVATPCLVRMAEFDLAAELSEQTLKEFDRLLHDPAGDEMVGLGVVEDADRGRGIALCMLTDGILLTCLATRWETVSTGGVHEHPDGFPGFRRRVVDAALSIDSNELGICALHAITRLVLGLGELDEQTLGWLHTYHEGLLRFGSEDAATYAELAAWMEARLRDRRAREASDSGAVEVADEAVEVAGVAVPGMTAKDRRVSALARLKQANEEALPGPRSARWRRRVRRSRRRGTAVAAP